MLQTCLDLVLDLCCPCKSISCIHQEPAHHWQKYEQVSVYTDCWLNIIKDKHSILTIKKIISKIIEFGVKNLENGVK
jgi:hypothetical protein